MLVQHGSTGHKDPLAVHQVESGESFRMVVVRGCRICGPLAVALRVKVWRSFKAHVDGCCRMLLRLSVERVSVLGPQVRGIESAANRREQIVRRAANTARLALSTQLVAVLVMMLLVRDQWPVIAVRARRLTGNVAAVLTPLLIAEVGSLLIVQDGRSLLLQQLRLLVTARAQVTTAAAGGSLDLFIDGIHHAALLFLRQRSLPHSSASHVDLHVRVIPRRSRPTTLVAPVMMMVMRSERRGAVVVAELSNQLSVHRCSFCQSRIRHRVRVIVSTRPVHASIALLLLDL